MEKNNRTAPLKVVLRKHGYLLFSGSKAGEEASEKRKRAGRKPPGRKL